MSSTEKAIVLLSGGLDSTVALAWAAQEHEVKRAVFFDYGQRAASMEAAAVEKIARLYEVELSRLRLPFFAEICGDLEIMAREKAHGPGEEHSSAQFQDIRRLWVPNRNAVFVSIGAAFAEALGCEVVVAGFNAEEAEQFPDNSAEFVSRANKLLELSTLSCVRLECPLIGLRKEEILELGVELGAPVDLIYSCYTGQERMCGRCMSCLHLKNAVARLPTTDARCAQIAAGINSRFVR